MKKLELIPTHPLARICDALNLLRWFEQYKNTVYDETADPKRQVSLSDWQTLGDVQLEYAVELIARANKAMEKKTITPEDLKLVEGIK